LAIGFAGLFGDASTILTAFLIDFFFILEAASIAADS
jgi:hypothetical protein